MIEIILTRENIGKHELVNNSWLYGINKNDTKPQFEYFQYYYNLIDVIHEWLYDNNIDYDLRMDDDGDARIIFKNKEDAMIFKLTWL